MYTTKYYVYNSAGIKEKLYIISFVKEIDYASIVITFVWVDVM